MDTRIHRKDRNGGEEKMTTITIDSFSTPGRTYLVSLDAPRSCECPHFAHTGARCRHILTALSVQRIRRSAWGNEAQERHARDLVAAVLDKRNGLRRSYDLALEAEFFRFSSPELRQIAWAFHRANVAREKVIA